MARFQWDGFDLIWFDATLLIQYFLFHEFTITEGNQKEIPTQILDGVVCLCAVWLSVFQSGFRWFFSLVSIGLLLQESRYFCFSFDSFTVPFSCSRVQQSNNILLDKNKHQTHGGLAREHKIALYYYCFRPLVWTVISLTLHPVSSDPGS